LALAPLFFGIKMVDFKSSIDILSRLNRVQARKLLSEILNADTNAISLSKHCRKELAHDNLTTVDLLNVLKAGLIYTDPELVNGTYRYRVETEKIIVVITFMHQNCIRCITAWRK